MKEKTVYVAADGTQWNDAELCRKYEAGEWIEGPPPAHLFAYWVCISSDGKNPVRVAEPSQGFPPRVRKDNELVVVSAKYPWASVTHWKSILTPEVPK